MTLSATLVFTNWVKACHYWFTRLVGLLLRDRRFRVHMGNDTSAWRPQSNSLPQGSVLAPVLFNLYSNDLPVTRGRKFIYADDMSRHSRPILQRTGMQSRQIWRGCHTSVDSGDLNQAPPKQSAVCSTCIILAPPVNCQFIWMASVIGMSATQPILWWPYAVLQRTLDEDCRQAEEPKQLVDEASRFHLQGRQRQHSAVICSGALLFSRRVLRPSLVTFCSHKSGRCACSWTLPCVSSLVPSVLHLSRASSALQHWTASPTKEGCHWQAGGKNRQTWQLANPP